MKHLASFLTCLRNAKTMSRPTVMKGQKTLRLFFRWSQDHQEIAFALGKGNVSKGIRIALEVAIKAKQGEFQ